MNILKKERKKVCFVSLTVEEPPAVYPVKPLVYMTICSTFLVLKIEKKKIKQCILLIMICLSVTIKKEEEIISNGTPLLSYSRQTSATMVQNSVM